jgi:hypothetical protein
MVLDIKMDQTTALLGTGTAGTILAVAMLVYKTLNHKRCRSKCCGWSGEISVDIENSTPPNEKQNGATAPKITT